MDAPENLRPPSAAWLGRRKTAPSSGLVDQLSHSKLMTRRNSADDRHTTVGICAMAKKIQAAPMQSILTRLRQQEYIKLVIFSDHTILNEPVEKWPLCNCLVAFYSKDFPLEKAIDYVKLRGPMLINDLQMQYALMDRRKVYEILQRHGVEVPKYVVLNRPESESSSSSDTLLETDDTIEVGGHVFHKPFVEKPISAEDHTVHIYFPSDYGGGCQQLFRKVKDRSSTYSKQSTVRKTGSYIYEEFMPTDGTDVKVYTVGPDYAHAEARKSPALDGKVERDEQGKEKRYPVFLTAREKLIARQVCLAFKQTVCGFDLLRTNGKSYVCDVNGFSFVKNSHKYYEDCAQILLEMITARLAPDYIPHVPPSVEYMAEEVPVPIPRTGNTLELRCVIGVIRHGDRTPKQKMKMIVKHKKFFELFEELDGYKTGHVKIKKPKQLQKVLDIARYLLENIENYHKSHEVTEKEHKLQQLKSVLEMYGYFSGINRKVQFKLVKNKMSGSLLLLILKWGGELTPAGQKQAEELGRAFRCMYPGGEGEYASLPGSGFLRLHSTYRHDLKVYASDEGRVQMTAAAFTRGLLDLEGNLASVLVHLVKRDQNATNMLDTSTSAQEAMLSVKEKLHGLLRSPANFTEKSFEDIAPTGVESVVSAMKNIKSPRVACEQLHQKIRALLEELKSIPSDVTLYRNEPLQIMIKRWAKLDKDLKMPNGQFDISKIPDIYDCIKYDLQHNSHLGLKNANDLFRCAMNLADLVIPQEYGITEKDKLDIATKICSPLLRKIQSDLQHTIVNGEADIIYRLNPRLSKGVVTPNRHVRTRLYFTSESHVHSMLNILRYGNLVDNPDTPEWRDIMKRVSCSPELSYMTQIVIMLYEDFSQSLDSEQRYHVEIHFSPGVKGRLELLQKGCRQPKDLLLGFSSTDGAGTKISPDQASKSPMWVKRLPPTLVEGTVRQSNASVLGSKSAPAVSRKISEPTMSQRSNSEVQLLKKISLSSIFKSEQHGLQSQSDSLLDHTPSKKTGEDRGKPAGEDSEIANFGSANPQQGCVVFTTNEEEPFSKTTHHGLEEKDLLPGLELAAELASTVEPLMPIWSAPLSKMNTFLTRITGITFDYKSEPTIFDSLSLGTPTPSTPTPSTPSPPPHPLHSPHPPTLV